MNEDTLDTGEDLSVKHTLSTSDDHQETHSRTGNRWIRKLIQEEKGTNGRQFEFELRAPFLNAFLGVAVNEKEMSPDVTQLQD